MEVFLVVGGVLGRRWRIAGAKHGARGSQAALNVHRDRVRSAKYAPRDPFRLLQRRLGLAEVVERGAVVLVERSRVAFEAEPRWVSRYDVYGPCGMVSQWATMLTITPNPAFAKLDPNSRAAREVALRAELAEDRY